MRAWLTPDAAAGDYACRRFSIPVEMLHIVTGALETLTHASSYEQHGTMTPEEAAALMLEMFNTYQHSEGECMTVGIGRIEYYSAPPTDEIAAGLLLPANNTWYLKADYPEFWQWAIDSGKSSRFDRTADYFATPDLSSKFIKSEGVGSLGDGGGQDSVTLTVANLPPHTHAQNQFGTQPSVVLGELPGFEIAPVAGVTGSTGSATPFDNRPNFSNELAYIRVR